MRFGNLLVSTLDIKNLIELSKIRKRVPQGLASVIKNGYYPIISGII